jgi:hypothetical protein
VKGGPGKVWAFASSAGVLAEFAAIKAADEVVFSNT